MVCAVVGGGGGGSGRVVAGRAECYGGDVTGALAGVGLAAEDREPVWRTGFVGVDPEAGEGGEVRGGGGEIEGAEEGVVAPVEPWVWGEGEVVSD